MLRRLKFKEKNIDCANAQNNVNYLERIYQETGFVCRGWTIHKNCLQHENFNQIGSVYV